MGRSECREPAPRENLPNEPALGKALTPDAFQSSFIYAQSTKISRLVLDGIFLAMRQRRGKWRRVGYVGGSARSV